MSIKMATTEYNSELILFWKDWQISNRTYPYLFEEVLKNTAGEKKKKEKRQVNKTSRKTELISDREK